MNVLVLWNEVGKELKIAQVEMTQEEFDMFKVADGEILGGLIEGDKVCILVAMSWAFCNPEKITEDTVLSDFEKKYAGKWFNKIKKLAFRPLNIDAIINTGIYL